MRQHALMLFALLTLAFSPLSHAGRVVMFSDGRSMEVAEVERGEGMIRLELLGGGQMAVPESQVTNWTELQRRPALRTASRPTTSVAYSGGAGLAQRWRSAAGPYADMFAATASKHGLDPALLAAVAHVESRFNPQAVSPKGAQGLLQLMPQTAERFGVNDAFDARENVEAGARYLSWLLERYKGDMDLALAGYNAGENAVDRHQGVPPYRETQSYVRSVRRYAALFAGSAR